MGRKFYLPLFVLVLLGTSSFAQTGEIRGKVTEKGGNEGIPFASVAALLNGTQVQATVTDFEGNYSIKPLNPGKYDVKATSVGYQASQISGVIVSSDKMAFANFELSKGIELGEVEIVDYEVPLIDKGSPATQRTVTFEEIQAAPTRDVNSIASQTAGIYQQDEGTALNIRGSRSDATSYYVDGIKVRGGIGLPQKGTEQVTVITGGVPAQYGDATGGIISVTTRGPSKNFAGGIELATSELLDPYGYNLAAFDVSGPIFTKKDSTGKKSGQPVAGFFLAGEYQYDKDPSPSNIPTWVVKEDILKSMEENPLRPAPDGTGFVKRSDFFTFDSLEESKVRPNMASKNYRVSGKIDIRPAKNLTLSLGGSLERTDNRNFTDIYSLMNYSSNSQTITTNWRAFAKVTQRFTSETDDTEKSSGGIKNAYYTLQVDYSKNNLTNQNPEHKDNIFDYGYVGKYEVLRTHGGYDGTFNLTGDTIFFDPRNQLDTAVIFTPGTQNPITTNYTEQYYALSEPFGTFGYTSSLSAIEANGGLLNGDNRTNLNTYGLFATPGRLPNGYTNTDNQQFRISASGSADIKNHNIVIGLEYEQRTDRGYTVFPKGLWTLMRQLGNQNITGYDLNSAIVTNGDLGGIPTVTTDYTRADYDTTRNVDGDFAYGFYENVRELLGLNAWDTVQVDAIDPSMYSLDLFTPDQLIDNGMVTYYGYDYLGNKQTNSYSIEDYYTKKDASNNFTRNIDAFRPNYIAGYIQDKFTFNDLIFNVGVRVDRFDANQQVLKDKYLLFETYNAGEERANPTLTSGGTYRIPDNIGNDYYVYVDNIAQPGEILGFRNEDVWYDANGNVITNLDPLTQTGGASGGIQPYLKNPSELQNSKVSTKIFEDYTPQVNVMPRIAFSFPISDEAYFAAHYDVLTQRPQNLNLIRFDPTDYSNLARGQSANISNPNLKPERTTDYEITFQQKLSKSSALSISAFYKELRDMIQFINVQFAHPITYTTYGNIDFGTVKGLTFGYDLRRTSNIRMNVSYTLQFADGTGSSATTSAGILAQQGQTNLREAKPLDFDQRHTFVTSFDYHYESGKNYNGPILWGEQILANAGANFVIRAGSGTPYTRKSNITPEADFTTTANSRSVISGSLNGSRLPWQFKIDAKFDKRFEIKYGKGADGQSRKAIYATAYLQVLNLLNSLNVNTVYTATGNPDDDGYITSPGAQPGIAGRLSPQAYTDLYTVAVNNPFHYNLPRRIHLGIQLNF
ncbi:MAG TPA: carboxypeptidase regulatory-like domain-containing protein [Bacteroidia bacterium]|nr:carboxypeptidase regulatory-like domain-containing protein [Bacteroidia bacterium]